MISIGENKAIICKGNFHPAELYKGDKKIAGYSVKEFEGTGSVILENCYNDKVYNASVYGKNLLDVNSIYPDYVNNEAGITYTNSDFAKILSINMRSVWKENTQYTFRADYEVVGVGGVFAFIEVSYTDGTRENFRYCFGGDVISGKGNCSITTQSQKTVSRAVLTYSGTRNNAYTIKLTNMQLEEGTVETEYEPPLKDATITIRGKNYFDINKVPFSNSTTQPYNNGLTAKKITGINRGNRIPISLPAGKTIYLTLDVVDSQIRGTAEYVTLDFFDESNTRIRTTRVTSTIAKKSYSFTLSEEVSYIQFYFQSASDSNAVGDYVTMDNIMLRCEGDDTYEPYIEPQTITVENGEPTKDIPTFKGTTVIEIESEMPVTISGKYKKVEE